jgi:Tfp pilus assembly protein PilZ
MQSEVKPVFIAILSSNKEDQTAIAEAARHHNVEFAFTSNIHELRDIVMEQPCCGVLLFITSLIGMDESGRSFIQTIEQVFPVARIRWHKTKASFALIGARCGQLETVSDFFRICSDFTPRCLRRNDRLAKTLNVLLDTTSDFSNAVRTFTTNISIRGCFLHTSCSWNIGDSLFIQIQEPRDKITLRGKVTRYVPWGVPFNIQGIGIHFINMDEHQTEALQHLLFYMPD